MSSLSEGELLSLYESCSETDEESAQLLASYLDQRLGADWLKRSGQERARPGVSAMPREEALAILGLEPGATTAEIHAAHRSLMQKLHPDRGGNNYLAAQLNRARDVLLG